MNPQRELIHLVCRLPEEDQATALQFLRALKAHNDPLVQQLQQTANAKTTTLKNQMGGTRAELLGKAKHALELSRYFGDRLDALLILDEGVQT